MSYKITRTVTFGGGFDQPLFTDWVDQFNFAEHGYLFPELGEAQFNETLVKIKERSLAPFGDVSKLSGVIDHSVTLTPEGAEEWIEFEMVKDYHDFVEYHNANNGVEGFLISYVENETRYFGDDVISGRRIVSSADPAQTPGTLLKLGSWIGKQWQIYRKSTVSYKVDLT